PLPSVALTRPSLTSCRERESNLSHSLVVCNPNSRTCSRRQKTLFVDGFALASQRETVHGEVVWFYPFLPTSSSAARTMSAAVSPYLASSPSGVPDSANVS